MPSFWQPGRVCQAVGSTSNLMDGCGKPSTTKCSCSLKQRDKPITFGLAMSTSRKEKVCAPQGIWLRQTVPAGEPAKPKAAHFLGPIFRDCWRVATTFRLGLRHHLARSLKRFWRQLVASLQPWMRVGRSGPLSASRNVKSEMPLPRARVVRGKLAKLPMAPPGF